MDSVFGLGMGAATRLTGAGRLAEATAVIQRTLGGALGSTQGTAWTGTSGTPVSGSAGLHSSITIEGVAIRRGDEEAAPSAAPFQVSVSRTGLADLVRGKLSAAAKPATRAADVPPRARWLNGSFTNDAGTRTYRLYVPGSYVPGTPMPLMVMLHGCTQSPDDFAAGTRMNEAAERGEFLVVYPGQSKSANMQGCWNWFSGADQHRDRGEPSIIAGITRQVAADHGTDPARCYIAGLSAGGAMAAIMGQAYPDLYAAIGVHSGLASGAAHDMSSAFSAMRSGSRGSGKSRPVPAIVFHGSSDSTVSPSNADAVLAQASSGIQLAQDTETGRAADGHSYRRIIGKDSDGRIMSEHWNIAGAGHAWSGGSKAGSYTDPHGPDATASMVRFFLQHRTTG